MKAKFRRFFIVRISFDITYSRPILGRLYAAYVFLRCIKLFKVKVPSYPAPIIFYGLTIPQYRVVSSDEGRGTAA